MPRELYASGSDNGRDFEAGIEVGLARILSGPEFLLYHGVTEDAALTGTSNQDDGAMLASRLALFLWNSIPDDALRDAGIAGRLREPAALEAEVHRMLADPRADTLVTETGPEGAAQYKLASLMIQAINHATEHRTQVSTILTQLGLEPPDMTGWQYMDETGEFQDISNAES